MIIECINCAKKFDVNAELIPTDGRTIQCGSCDHVWFFKINNQNKSDFLINDAENDEEVFKDDSIFEDKITKKDTSITLAKKILKQEHKLYPVAILKIFN